MDGSPGVTELPGYRRTFAEGELTLGLTLPVGDPEQTEAETALVRTAEEAGVAAVWARDIPLRVETFGDVGQVHDPFMYLTWLAAHTTDIALGSAAVVLPLAHPLLLAKRSASLDRLSGGRFLMGVASGDRPEEFPAFGLEKGERAELFRENLEVLRKGWASSSTGRPVRWSRGRMGGADVVPVPSAGAVPVLPTGSCQQNMAYNAAHGDGWFTYHRSLPQQKVMVDRWRSQGEFKPFAESMWVELDADPALPVQGRDFGYRTGRDGLLQILRSQRDLGINHVSLHLRGARPVAELLEELAEHVVPEFHSL